MVFGVQFNIPERVFTDEYRRASTDGIGYQRDNLLRINRLGKFDFEATIRTYSNISWERTISAGTCSPASYTAFACLSCSGLD